MTSLFYLGFDPGGVDAFGWAVAAHDKTGVARVVTSGRAPNAEVAVDLALGFVPDDELGAVGIDAPLFWTPTGVRRADAIVRSELRARGAISPGGTVQQLNSLRGACLVQGIAAAMLIRRRCPQVPITETHPKALLWHLGLATIDRPSHEIRIADLAALLIATGDVTTEHERDALISCVAAVAFQERRAGWRDLAMLEPDPLHIVPGGVAYWMPCRGPNANDYAC
jgi:predicted nuclease with RNAse H fold